MDAPLDAATLLARHLEGLRRHGRSHIRLSDEARRGLQSLARGSTPRPPLGTPPAPTKTANHAPTPQPRPDSASSSKAQRLAALRERAAAARSHPALQDLRDSFVFAVGNPDARIVFVGEAPGFEEERKGEPFVGPAGQLLDRIIQTMGLDRSQVYISNIVKWRPRIGDTGDQGVRNRKPTSEEMKACRDFVVEEIRIIKPDIIVALGASAAEGLLGETASVSSLRERFFDLDGTPVIVTYHPSYLLRNQAPSERRKVWEDMLRAMDRIGMPVSEKQRRFFLPKDSD